jgi:hypothetical protein
MTSRAEIETAIHHALDQVERERDVRILFACESGSRGWGFESQDSDYDVRFIYAHRLEWYLSVESHRFEADRGPRLDVLNRFLAGEIARFEALHIKPLRRPPVEEMDRFFRGAVERAWAA